MKDRKANTIFNSFIKIVNESKRKPNKLWVDQEKELHNSLMQKLLDNNNFLMYSTQNEGKSVVAERFIRNLKGKIYKKNPAYNSKFYLGHLNKLVDEYNNTYHRSIGKEPIYTDYSGLTEEIESSHKASQFKVGDRTRETN